MMYKSVNSNVNGLGKDDAKLFLSKEYKLGKFFFSVSLGTTAFFLANEKIASGAVWNATTVFALIALIGAILLSLVIALPQKGIMKESAEFFDKKSLMISPAVSGTYTWFIIWFIGACTGAWSLIH